MSNKCIILVPVYKEHMTNDEKMSFRQLRTVLGNYYQVALICPESMNPEEYHSVWNGPLLSFHFDNEFFTDRMAYCKLLNSQFFYKTFIDYEYILIYQLDCWVFRNELDDWCDKGYDYIGAPFFVKWFSDRGLYVGNGGFSLRKTSAMITYLDKFLGKGLPHENTDDGFFAANFDGSLKIPSPIVAAEFSLEEAPAQHIEKTGKLPFGCHAYKKYDWEFWKQHINYDAYAELKENVTFCILTYKESENAKTWYRRFKDYFDTYIIDTYVIDNNAENPYKEFGDDPHIRLTNNVYNGGQRQIAYKHMVEDGRKWMMTVDADVEMKNPLFITKLLASVEKVVKSNNIGIYEVSAERGSKCQGTTQLVPTNLHLFRQGTGTFREVEEGEGWFRLVKKEIADRIYPFQNFEDNKYGWGGEAHYYLAKQMGLKTVIDDTFELYHPDGITYDNTEAVKEREKFFARFPELGIEIPQYKGPDDIKTLICCIGKNENRYVREYVEWHKHIGVSHIRIYDNNDPDGEHFEDAIGDYINEGFVDLVDVRGQKVVQLKCYTECYHELKNDYDWILFIDCGDEYLTFNRGQININQYLTLPQFRNYDMIHINLMTVGDNGLVEYDNRPLMERFPEPIPFDTNVAYNFPEDMHVSSIVRGGLEDIKWEGNGFTHTPSPNNLRCCNNVGFSVDSESPFAPIDFQFAAFKHYTTKTASEYCDKMRRGFPDQLWDGSRVKNLIETRFFRTNEITKEKIEVFKRELGIDMSYLLPEDTTIAKRDDVKIYSLCYAKKNFEFLNDAVITPLQVGAANGTEVCATKDNTGDNISADNYFYIENTGTYWIWKNVKDAKIKGQMQYRRPLSGVSEAVDFEKVFTDYDVITCEPFHHPDHKEPTPEEPMVISADTVEQGYWFSNCVDDLYVLELVIQLYHPDYYEDYVKYIKNGPDLYYSNGFIMKAEDYDRYCEFLFDCLQKYREMTNIHTQKDLIDHVRYNMEVGKYPRYPDKNKIPQEAVKWQCSIGGFLSERVWTLWLQHNFKPERILKLPYIKQEEGMYT